METAFEHGLPVNDTKEVGKKINDMGLENRYMSMERNMRVDGRTMWNTDMG